MNSSRLSGKVLLDILGKPMLWHIYNRLIKCNLLDTVVISTGDSSRNKQIVDFAKNNDIPIYVGSEDDLLGRLYGTAVHFEASAIVRITADCPLVDPDLVDELVRKYIDNENDLDIVTNCIERTYPHGLDVEVFSIGLLEKIHKEFTNDLREWFSLYIQKNPSKFKLLNKKYSTNLSNYRWTVDYSEDYEFIKKIYENLYVENQSFSIKQILSLLQTHPQLLEINSKHSGMHNVGSPTI